MTTFDDIAEELKRRTDKVVWASAATIDREDRTRIRILHPVWEGRIAWIFTNRVGLVSKHLARRPSMSLSYVDSTGDGTEQVYVDGSTEWIDEVEQKQRVWDYVKSIPEPVGYDPATSFQSVDNPKFGVLRLTPWRIEVGSLTARTGWQQQIWHADS